MNASKQAQFRITHGVALLCLILTAATTACSGHASSQFAGINSGALPNIVPPQTQPAGSSSPAPSVPNSGALPNIVPPQPNPPLTQASDMQPVAVQLRYKLPVAPATQSRSHRRLEYISSSNTQLTITVTPLGGSGTNYGPTACTSGSCAVNFTANPGPNTIAFTLTDGTNTLSKFSTTTIVQPAIVNSLSFSANPVVNSVTLTLQNPTITAGIAVDDLLTVTAKDFDGNTIVGNDRYVDVNGNPISLVLNVSNAQAGGRGTVLLSGPPRITAPGQAAVYARYDGKWLDRATIGVTTTGSIAGALTGTTLTTIPHVFEYAAAGSPHGIVSGPDGNLWFVEFNGNRVDKISTNGTNFTPYPCTPCDHPHYIANGPDGKFWISEYFGNYVDSVTPGGATTRLVSIAGQVGPIVPGPDGKLWYSSDSGVKIGKVSTDGFNTAYAAPGGNQIRGIGFGPDGNLWYLDITASTIGRVTQTGTFLGAFALPSIGSASDSVVTGPDGNLWFVGSSGGSNFVGKITPSGTPSTYALQASAAPRNVITGPDGNMWFTEAGTASIGRIATNGSGLTEYGAAFGISAASNPLGITIGPDGNIWFTEYGANKVAKFVL